MVTGAKNDAVNHPCILPEEVNATNRAATPPNSLNDFTTERTTILCRVSIVVEHSVPISYKYTSATPIDTMLHVEVSCEPSLLKGETLSCKGPFGHSHLDSVLSHECVGTTEGAEGLAM